MNKEAQLAHIDKQGGRVPGMFLNKQAGLANLCRDSYWRKRSSGQKYLGREVYDGHFSANTVGILHIEKTKTSLFPSMSHHTGHREGSFVIFLRV